MSIIFKNNHISGFEAAIRSMRNPMDSWHCTDSYTNYNGMFVIGEKDLELAKKLVKNGDDHGKIARMIHVSVDVTAPMYWWKEYDTYKVGTVRMSCSTMYKLHSRDLTIDDFSHEHLFDSSIFALDELIGCINHYRQKFISDIQDTEINKKEYWWQMIQLLPSSFNQMATIDVNYQTLRNIYRARKSHKLDEWHAFASWILSLPYANELIIGE